MKLIVKTNAVKDVLRFPGTVKVVAARADQVAASVSARGGVPVSDIVFPDAAPAGAKYPGAVRRSDEMGRTRAYSTVTVTHPNPKRRAALLAILQSEAAAATDLRAGR